MCVWVLVTLLIGVSSRVFCQGENQHHVFRDFHMNQTILRDVDKTLDSVLENFLTPSSYTSIHNVKLKNGYGSHNNWNITAIGSCILNDIDKLSEQFGIMNQPFPEMIVTSTTTRYYSLDSVFKFVHDNQRSYFADSVYHELYRFPWKLIPLASKSVSNFKEYCQKNKYLKKGYLSGESLTSKNREKYNIRRVLRTPIFINDWKHYIIGVRQCLSSPKPYFNLPKAAIDIIKYPPEGAAAIVKSRLRKPIPRHPPLNQKTYSTYEAVACQMVTPTTEAYYQCLKELRRIDGCAVKRMEKAAERKALRAYRSRKFWPSAVKLTESIGDLNDSCKLDHKASTMTCFISDQSGDNSNHTLFLGNYPKLTTVAGEAQKMIRNMIELMLQSQVGADALDEIETYVYIYHRSVEAQDELSKTAGRSHRARDMYLRMTNNVETYKQHLARVAFGAINDVRTVINTVEGTLVKSMSRFLGIDSSEHVRTMRCFDEFVDSIIGPWFGFGGSDHSHPSLQKPARPMNDGTKPSILKPDGTSPSILKPNVTSPSILKPDGTSPSILKPDGTPPENLEHDLPENATPVIDKEGHEQLGDPLDQPNKEERLRKSDEIEFMFSNGWINKLDDFHESGEAPARRGVIPRAEAARNLMNSLKRLGNAKLLRRQSTITSLANTFLLATMFYECITVLAAAIYRTERNIEFGSPTVSPHPISQMGPEIVTSGYDHESWEKES
ncbi:uncharacterized protein [Fopius arisanus]|uniref:Uncharacterized protein n=2 Tax=Fopius arisanus TaxID=64838 RepID=A0A9R1T826_9HYME|nr:PREDICTED: uncharacterized protein LOC105267188 [Fopius arisanus]